MRHLLLLWALVGVVSAQLSLMTELPPCALNCIVEGLTSTNCSLTDLGCMCASEALWTNVEACTLTACSTREALTAAQLSRSACKFPVRDRSLSVAVVGPTLAGVSCVFVLLRLFARRFTGRNRSFGLGWDDFVLVAAWLSGLPKAIMDPLFRDYGLGRDIWEVPFDDIDRLLRLFYFGELSYHLSVSLTKIALLAFFLRVFPSRTFRRIAWGMVALVTAFNIAFLLPLLFQCHPIDYAWLRWDGEHTGTCINVFAAFLSHGVINMVLDITILILPLPQLWKLQLTYSPRRKVQILSMFSVGCIVTVFSIIRLDSLLVFEGSDNPTWDYWGAAIWSVVEMYVGVICACLPATKVFFSRLLKGVISSVPTRDAAADLGGSGSQTWVTAAGASHGRSHPSRVQSPENGWIEEPKARAFMHPLEMEEVPLRHIARVSLV